MSADKLPPAEQSFFEIVGRYIQDPENGLLIDHVFGPDGSRRTSPLFEERVASVADALVKKYRQEAS